MSDNASHTQDHALSRPTSTQTGAGGSFISSPHAKKVLLFVVVAVVWLCVDVFTKAIANSYDKGEVFWGPFAGLVQFRLAYNTGAAWSVFSDSAFALGIVSLVLIAVIAGVIFFFSDYVSLFGAAMLGLVFAGGLGNALDRFILGYVVDFIQVLFISFPTFNVADIGVTCGIVLFVVSMLWGIHRSVRTEKENQNHGA